MKMRYKRKNKVAIAQRLEQFTVNEKTVVRFYLATNILWQCLLEAVFTRSLVYWLYTSTYNIFLASEHINH